MSKRNALRLVNRDEVEVRVGRNHWIRGYVLGAPRELPEGIVVVDVMTPEEGFMGGIPHGELR